MAVGLGAHPPAKTKPCIFVSSPSRAWINHMVSVSPPPASKNTFFGLASPSFHPKKMFRLSLFAFGSFLLYNFLKAGQILP
jgi:hypothetical protein